MPKHLKTKSENGRVTSAGRLVLLKENKCAVAGFLTGFEMAADGVQFQRTAQRSWEQKKMISCLWSTLSTIVKLDFQAMVSRWYQSATHCARWELGTLTPCLHTHFKIIDASNRAYRKQHCIVGSQNASVSSSSLLADPLGFHVNGLPPGLQTGMLVNLWARFKARFKAGPLQPLL